MPSDRFHNLKQVKKRSFLAMAYKEFSLHSYEGASITRLVADLKMAKGSIYQYFDAKEDLYNYLVKHAYDQLHQVIAKACPASASIDFNTWYTTYLMVYIKFLCAIPSYGLLFKRHKTDFPNSDEGEMMDDLISKSLDNSISNERRHLLGAYPLLIFNYIIKSEKINIEDYIRSGKSLDIPSEKLLYLCKAFLK